MTLHDAILDAGFLKLLFDGTRAVWRKAFSKVTADFYVALTKSREDQSLYEKQAFLVVRNRTKAEITVSGMILENNLWYRLFPRIGRYKQDEVIMKVPPGKGMQLGFVWRSGNLLNPSHRFCGIILRDQKVVWIKRRRWKQVCLEYIADFPDWELKTPSPSPVRHRVYPGSQMPQQERLK